MLAAAISLLAVGASAQFGTNFNITPITGTWSTGTGAVVTGTGPEGDICTPGINKFTYPKNTGMSYSFTDDGFFEEVQYRYDSNATNHHCIRGKILWQHGTYELLSDGKLVLTPFPEDGRIQVQDPCAAETNAIYSYNQVTTFKYWGTIVDPAKGVYTLLLNRFDGAQLPPMYQVFNPPNMLPTHELVGTNSTGQNVMKRSFENNEKRSSASSLKISAAAGIAALALCALL